MRVNPDSTTNLTNTVIVTPPAQKQTVHNVFLIDASGSMAGVRYRNAMSGVNELLKGICEDQFTNNTLTIVEFRNTSIRKEIFMSSSIPNNYDGIGADGSTPLNQAVGQTCEDVLKHRNNVFTDGGENTSIGKYKDPYVLSTFIKKLEGEGFTVTFQGTQSEVNYAINTLNLSSSNTSVHDNSASGIAQSFMRTAKARQLYSKSVAKGEAVTSNFYSKTVEPDQNA